MTGQSSMENNNSIPYGSISWDNEDSFPLANQQREPQGIPPLRPSTLPSSNGVRYSLRGPHFPQPQQRLRGVGISRNLELANHLQQGETPQSSQQPSSSRSSSTPYERFFTLQPSRSTSQTHMHSMEPQSSNSTIEGQCYATLYANPSPGPSSGNPALTLVSEDANFSARTVYSENACNNNIEMPQGFTRDGCERFHASRAKRKSSLSNDEGQDGPSTKQFLSEERMAARMHNLRISSDHNYQVNIMQRFMDSFNQASNSSERQIDYDDDDDEFENADGIQRRRDNLPVFVLSSNVKEAMAKTEPIIPEAIYNQLSKPCLAVVPWKSPDDRLSLSTGRKQVDGDKNESEPSNSSNSSCTSLIMESIPEETEQFQDKGVHHVEIVGDCSTFNFDDDDMEL